MKGQYFKPGIAAIALAILFPVYWLLAFDLGIEGIEAALLKELMSFDWWDGLFILIGALEVYIYMSLRHLFKHQLDSTAIQVMLALMIGTIVLFHGLVIVDVVLAMSATSMATATAENTAEITVEASIWILMAHAISGLVFSVLLLAKGSAISTLLKVFAVLLLIGSLMQLTIFLSVVNLLLFPIALVLLAVFFLNESANDMVEVV